MKSFIPAVILFSLLTTASFSQENFKVIKVNGVIMLKSRGTSLETGTVFSERDDLLFRTDDATAAVINSRRGRLILTSQNHDLSSARSNFLPDMYNIASRGGKLKNIIDLRNHFSDRYVVLERQSIILDQANFPMNDDNFFFLRYEYKGESINKKLKYYGDTLIIDKADLYTVDGNPIPSPDNTAITLYYKKGSEYTVINGFELIFPDADQLKKEVRVIIDELKGQSPKEKVTEINAYIGENYGRVYNLNLLWWLGENYDLHIEQDE